jgi:hypothetical protein
MGDDDTRRRAAGTSMLSKPTAVLATTRNYGPAASGDVQVAGRT